VLIYFAIFINHSMIHPTTVLIHTVHGNIKVIENNAPLKDLIPYVESNTNADDQIFSCPYGSGVNYLVDRPSPSFQTQCSRWRLSEKLVEKQIEMLSLNPPAMIISADYKWEILSIPISRLENPELWEYIDSNYFIDHFIEGDQFGYRIYKYLPDN